MKIGTSLSVAVVIPVLGDIPALADLLAALAKAVPAPREIVVVDGAASDACRLLCLEQGARYYAPRKRAAATSCATAPRRPAAEVLWFLHADAQLHGAPIAAITAAVRAGAVGGYFRFRFAGPPGWHKRALAALINVRARLGVPYGDQGLFATQAAYAAAGGFADVPLFEEVQLVKQLRRAGRFVALDDSIGVSPRRWERDGWLRRTLENRALALAYLAGVSPQRLAQRYRAPRPENRRKTNAECRTPASSPPAAIRAATSSRMRSMSCGFTSAPPATSPVPFCLEGSRPGDNRLQRMTLRDTQPLMDEAMTLGVRQFSFTGGEPFVVRDFINILAHAAALRPCLVLTNGTDAVLKRLRQLDRLQACANPISFRVSIDYPDEARHDAGRGPGRFRQALAGMKALHERGFGVSLARQMQPGEDAAAVAAQFRAVLARHGLPADLRLVMFPDFGLPGESRAVPEITEDCMTRYHTETTRRAFMCAFSKMVVKQAGRMRIYACTLVDDDPSYDLGGALGEAMSQRVMLHHHRCYACFRYGSSCSEL